MIEGRKDINNPFRQQSEIDYSNIRTVRVHKEQYEAIEKKAKAVIITCKEDGRCIIFNRVD